MQRSEIRVRRAVPDDLPLVVALTPRFAATRPHWRTEDEVRSGTQRALERALRDAREDEAVFVADDPAGRPVGFAYVVASLDFFTGEPAAHVSEIAVLRDGTGAGSALMKAAEAWALRRGARYVSLHVNAGNETARAFYERLGYDLEWRRFNKRLA